MVHSKVSTVNEIAGAMWPVLMSGIMVVDGALTAVGLGAELTAHGVDSWSVAGNDPALPLAPPLPTAISFLIRLRPASTAGLDAGPTPEYVAEYRRVNRRLIAAGEAVTYLLSVHGFCAERVDDDAPDGPGDPPIFPSKTAATRSGLGWVGKTALLVTREFGSAVRLGTVFTDLLLSPRAPIVESRCGSCRACVDACPAAAGRDVIWRAGTPQSMLYDSKACDTYQRRFAEYDEICGICIWTCPYTQRALRAVAPMTGSGQ
jgi:epoxyqueuosine reductase